MKQRCSLHTLSRKAGLLIGLAAVSFFSAQNAFAECAASHCEDVRILTLYTAHDNRVFIKVAGTTSNLNCTLYGGVYILVPESARFKEYYATLLAAQMADRPVSFGAVAGSSPCMMNSIYINTP